MDEFNLGTKRKWCRGLQTLPRVFFGMFYHQFSRFYDLVTRTISMGLWKTWLATLLSYVSGQAILELGSGPGHLLKLLKQHKLEAFGLEESAQMIALASMRLEKEGIKPIMVRAIAEAIPFRSGVFDQVVSSFPAEFITHQKTLGEIYRVLKDGGELVILRFAWLSENKWPYKLMTWLFRLVGEAPGISQSIPFDRLSAPFQKAGFMVNIDQVDLTSSGMIILRCKKMS